MSLPRLLALPLAALLLAASGCGGTGSSGSEATRQSNAGGGGDNALSATDTADVLGALRTIDGRCGGDAAQTAGGQDVPAAVQTIVRVAQSYPTKVYETGNSARAERMRDVAGTTASELRACGIGDQAAPLVRVSSGSGA